VLRIWIINFHFKQGFSLSFEIILSIALCSIYFISLQRSPGISSPSLFAGEEAGFFVFTLVLSKVIFIFLFSS